MRIFAIGDIHGCIEQLKSLIETINPSKDDTLVFLGDYIDRGPDSQGVIDFLLHLKNRCKCIFLMGNHEDELIKYCSGKDGDFFRNIGGRETIASYTKSKAKRFTDCLPESHWEFFNSLLLYHEDESYIYVHSGIKPSVPLKDQDKEDLLWKTNENYSTGMSKKVIYGHRVNIIPRVDSDKIGIDTGCIITGVLTAIELPQETFIQTKKT